MRISGTQLEDNTFLFQGAGEASLGIAGLLVNAMEEKGIDTEVARAKIWMFDSKGLVTKSRSVEGLAGHKKHFAKEAPHMKSLEEVVNMVKPTVLIGAAGIPKVFTPKILQAVAGFSKTPVIFALSNPTSKAECTAEDAYTNTEGRCVFSSGSPFPNFVYNGKEFQPGQGNNAYIFPGVALGIISCGIYNVTDAIFLHAASVIIQSLLTVIETNF
jgi:malate dehydrogenase (oxaloacetate-decarboxylating)(NADP+)